MLVCENCGHEQGVGKFCGKCGSPVIEKKDEQAEQLEGTNEQPTREADESNERTASNETEQVEEEVSATEQTAQSTNEQPSANETDAVPQHDQTNEQVNQTEQTANNESQGHAQQEQATAQQSGQQNVDISNLAKDYWNYFLLLLKNPTKALAESETSLRLAMINLVLYGIIFSIALTTLINKTAGMFADLPIFSIFFSVFVFLIVVLATVLLGIFLVDIMFIKRGTIKLIVARYGSLITPLLAIHVLAFITSLGGSIIVTPLLLNISLFLAVILLPSLYVFEESKHHVQGQKVYLSIATVFIIVILLYFIIRIILVSMFGDVMSDLEDMLYYLW